MTERENIEELAAEFVLGTLSGEERAAASARRDADAALDSAILGWERRLGPLIDTVRPVSPPPELYQKIRAQIGLASHVVSLKSYEQRLVKRADRWRSAAAAMTAIAATLAGVLIGREIWQPPMASTYVAVLQAESQTPAFLMTVDMKTHMCAIKSVAAPVEPEKSYELWMVHESMPKPKSLGLIATKDMEVMPMYSGVDADLFMKATFAVSLEPQGGSPTGVPTGPVMYAGRLVQSTP